MSELDQLILRTDLAGMPLGWADYRDVLRLHVLGQIAYQCGSTIMTLRGGINARSQKQSVVEINSIIATFGDCHTSRLSSGYTPPLNNPALFRRDAHICMYCGETFAEEVLSRDHVTPMCKGGADSWTNVVAACFHCNNKKAGRTPEDAGMSLLAIPFVPTHAEYVYLQGRNVLADQMEFLRAHFPRSSPIHQRLELN